MINLRDAKILYNAIVTMSGSNICNMKDGDLIRRLHVFNLLNCFFEDGIEVQADRDDDGKIKSYSLRWREDSPIKQGEIVDSIECWGVTDERD